MTVKELITLLSKMEPDSVVHCDMDDYPKVTGVRSGATYSGPADYTPPDNSVLLEVE